MSSSYSLFKKIFLILLKPDVEDAFEAFARSMGSLTADDSIINTVVPLDAQYLWSDKYRPRKPRVFNKVHTVCIHLI
jgi:hypothetical protein